MDSNHDQFDYSKMNRQPGKLRRHFDRGLTAFMVVAACIVFFVLLLRIDVIGGAIKKILGILSPIWCGCAFAFLLNPLVRWCERKLEKLFVRTKMKERSRRGLCRGLSIFLSLAVIIAIIALLINMLIPQLYKSVVRLITLLPDEFDSLQASIANMAADSRFAALIKETIENIVNNVEVWMKTDALGNISSVMSSITTTAKSVVGGVIDAVIGLIVCIYILTGKETFGAQAKKSLYANLKRDRANFVLHIARKSNEIFSGFLVGKIIDSAIIGVLCFIGMSIFRISENYTLLVSVIVGVTNIIPFFGPYFGAIPSAFLILLEDPLHCLYFIIFILVLQQLDGNVIGPSILGESTGLSAFWVIVAILLGGGLFGFFGMIIGVPAFAVLYYIVDLMLTDKLRRKGLATDTAEYVDMVSLNEDDEIVRSSDLPEVPEKLKLGQKIRLLWENRRKKQETGVEGDAVGKIAEETVNMTESIENKADQKNEEAAGTVAQEEE